MLETRQLEIQKLSGRGVVYSYSIVRYTSTKFAEFVPYVVALVQLTEGPIVTAQITDVDVKQVYIGMPVEIVTRKLFENGENGVIVYGPKFRPLLQS